MIDVYPWAALILSLVAFVLFLRHTLDASRAYRRYHDDRAAYDLLVALTMTVVALGLTASAAAAFMGPIGVEGRSEVRNVGLGVVRGAVVMTAAAMAIADARLARAGREG